MPLLGTLGTVALSDGGSEGWWSYEGTVVIGGMEASSRRGRGGGGEASSRGSERGSGGEASSHGSERGSGGGGELTRVRASAAGATTAVAGQR
eukprot:658680-Prymnesium_polylepis.1